MPKNKISISIVHYKQNLPDTNSTGRFAILYKCYIQKRVPSAIDDTPLALFLAMISYNKSRCDDTSD